jgi:predicted nucleic acid-binding protein
MEAPFEFNLPPHLFCDTSFFYACFDSRDVNHQRAEDLSAEAAESGSTLYVTWDIISETLTLLRYRRSYRVALTFLSEIKPDLHIVNYGDSVRAEAEQIVRRYGRDHKLSFCDAVSFVVVTTLLDDIPSLVFDEDFRALGLIVIP